MATYDVSTRKLGDGYTYYDEYSHDDSTPETYGEPTLNTVVAADDSFGGTDPTGSEFAVEREFFEDEISQELSPVARLIIGEKATYKIMVSAGNLTTLAVSLGIPVSAIASVTAADLPDVYAGNSLMIGGRTLLQTVALVLEVCNSYSPNLSDYLYMPNCTAGSNATIKYVKNEVRKVEVSFSLQPSKQDAFLSSSACSVNHGLAKIIFEKNP